MSGGRSQGTWTRIAVAALLLLFVGQAMLSARRKSVTVDELMYIAAGYYHLRTGDFQLNMTNPPLAKYVSAAPLLLLDLDLPEVDKHPKDLDIIEQWQYARAFMFDNRADPDRILFLARVPVILIGALLGLYLFTWCRALYGEPAGLFALGLFAFSPNLLAHARLGTIDLTLTAVMFVCAYYFWRFVTRPGWRPLLLCGVTFGLSILCKPTGFFLLPIFGAFYLVSIIRNDLHGIFERLPLVARLSADRRRLRQVVSGVGVLIVLGLAATVVVNAGYGFQGSFAPLSPLMDMIVVAGIGGAVVGAAQSLVLRRHFAGWFWWLPLSSLGWAALFPGAIPGAALVWLARTQRSRHGLS